MIRKIAAAGVVCLLFVTTRPVVAQESPSESFSGGAQAADAPESFNMRASALPVEVTASAPTALPLDVVAGFAYSGVSVNSQPLIVSEAAPVYVPLAGALGLLGGPGALFGIVAGLGPSLVVGAPTIFGLDPLPVDPTIVPLAQLIAPAAGLPFPSAPALGCFSYFPGEPREASCGGPIQDAFGFRGRGSSATTSSKGEPDQPASLESESAAALLGVDPAEGNTFAPFEAGSMRSAAFARVRDGRAESGASTSVSEVEIAGVLRIPSIDSGVTAALDGTKERASVSERRCSLAGATIAGVPVELRPEGFVLADQATLPVPIDLAAATVNRALETAGVTIGAGPADPGVLQIIPYPGTASRLAEDGTEFETSFGCLQLVYRIPVSGTDMRVTFGKVALRSGAYAAEPFESAFEDSADATLDESASELDPSAGLGVAAIPTIGPDPLAAIGAAPAPAPPKPGAGTPPPSARAFTTASRPFVAAQWSVDGGWLAPYAVLALALPVLAKARRFSILGGHR